MWFKVQWKGANIIISFYGNLIYGDVRFSKMEYQIADFSKIEKFEFTKEEIEIISTLESSSTI